VNRKSKQLREIKFIAEGDTDSLLSSLFTLHCPAVLAGLMHGEEKQFLGGNLKWQ
jgi:hypothetical protein